MFGDRGSTVFKVLCYKSEGRWFDPSIPVYHALCRAAKVCRLVEVFFQGATMPPTPRDFVNFG